MIIGGVVGGSEFHTLLRAILARRGMTVPGLARRCSYSRQYVWEVATGRKRAAPQVVRALDVALDAGGALVAAAGSGGVPGEVCACRAARQVGMSITGR